MASVAGPLPGTPLRPLPSAAALAASPAASSVPGATASSSAESSTGASSASATASSPCAASARAMPESSSSEGADLSAAAAPAPACEAAAALLGPSLVESRGSGAADAFESKISVQRPRSTFRTTTTSGSPGSAGGSACHCRGSTMPQSSRRSWKRRQGAGSAVPAAETGRAQKARERRCPRRESWRSATSWSLGTSMKSTRF
mmetsp:Transcript_101472/g.302668  ORF Transcript_101472/g.302668 Transcript_101472/m.302668 type:complete len:203 (-) Transcript_101472:1192-1800(-)